MPVNHSSYDVIILGAGVSGLACAHFLAQKGQRIRVLDDYASPGGNHLSCERNGFTFDVGSIFFQSGDPQFRMFPGSAANFVPVDLSFGRITPLGQVHMYPLALRQEILSQPWVLLRFVFSLGLHRFCRGPGNNAESYAIHRIGRFLYQRSGLRNYLRRFYGIDPKEVSLHFVNRRMDLARLSSLRRALQNLMRRVSPVHEPRPSGHKSHSLARPIEGFSVHYQKVARVLHAEGVEVSCSAGLKSIRKAQDGFEISTTGERIFATRVVNTMPLQTIFSLLGHSEPMQIVSTKLCTLCCSFSGHRGFETVVLYNFDDKGAWKRLTMHSDYYGRHEGREFFCVEVSLRDQKTEPEGLFEDFASHVQQLGLFRGDLRLEGHMNLDFAYPVCDMQAEDRRLRLIELLSETGIETIGRQGLFDYIPHSSIAIEAVAKRFA